MSSGAIVLLPGEGTKGWNAFGTLTVKATAESTGGMLHFMEASDPEGHGTPMHQDDAALAYYVLEGSYEFVLGDRRINAPTGTFLFIPGGVPYAFAATADGGRRITVICPAA